MSPQPGYQIPGRAPVDAFPDSGYWNQQFRSEPYFLEGDSYDDYEPAYRLGYQARHQHPGRDFDSLDEQLQRDWAASKGLSRLDWQRARQAALRAWERGEPRGM
ncbi:hypothetical protein [Pseudoxanthomonas kaohsiungensis]|uniref:hypothetical protein n=1 Tax=Pseudoxanthomonas kaohsiungensis TaxID=283923 RepID=UPI0035B21861